MTQRLGKNSSRMTVHQFLSPVTQSKLTERVKVMSISDLNEKEALRAASHLRSNWKWELANEEDLEESVSLVGGRLSHLNQVRILFFPVPE